MKKDPEGYKKLLVYKKADELHWTVLELAKKIKGVEREKREKGDTLFTHSSHSAPYNKILLELADQLGRAARSPKSNIVEGWKRNTTKEYFDYLGFSIGSTEEIKEDVSDVIRGKYSELKGVKGIMGEKGIYLSWEQIIKIPFYPLNPLLPFIIQIYLRTKELLYLLYKLQESLFNKMKTEGTLSMAQRYAIRQKEDEARQASFEEYLKGIKKK